jgi:hypothetical protein
MIRLLEIAFPESDRRGVKPLIVAYTAIAGTIGNTATLLR